MRPGPIETAQKPLFGIHRRQRCLDRRAGTHRINEVGAQDIAVVVHRPYRPSLEPDSLLAQEIDTPEVAIAIQPVSVPKDEIIRTNTAWLGSDSITDIGGALRIDDKPLQFHGNWFLRCSDIERSRTSGRFGQAVAEDV